VQTSFNFTNFLTQPEIIRERRCEGRDQPRTDNFNIEPGYEKWYNNTNNVPKKKLPRSILYLFEVFQTFYLPWLL